jgi:hypothetical protein
MPGNSKVENVVRPELPDDLEVYIDSLDEQGRVTYISGYFVYRRNNLKFAAIGMDGYGGPNIAATLSDETLTELRRLGLDDTGIDEVITALQRKIMEGQAHIRLQPDEKNPVNDQEATNANQAS